MNICFDLKLIIRRLTWRRKKEEISIRSGTAEYLTYVASITAEIAAAKAEMEFEKHRVIQDRLFLSDFYGYML